MRSACIGMVSAVAALALSLAGTVRAGSGGISGGVGTTSTFLVDQPHAQAPPFPSAATQTGVFNQLAGDPPVGGRSHSIFAQITDAVVPSDPMRIVASDDGDVGGTVPIPGLHAFMDVLQPTDPITPSDPIRLDLALWFISEIPGQPSDPMMPHAIVTSFTASTFDISFSLTFADGYTQHHTMHGQVNVPGSLALSAVSAIATSSGGGGPGGGLDVSFTLSPVASPQVIPGNASMLTITIDGQYELPDPCFSDIAPIRTGGDGLVGIADLLAVIGTWGACSACTESACPADIDNNCNVGIADLLEVIGEWGACPP